MKRLLGVFGTVVAIGFGCGGGGSGGGGGKGGTSTTGAAGTTGSGGSGACVTGDEGCACYPNDTCNGTLQCLSHLCVSLTGTAGAMGAAGSAGAAGTTGAGGQVVGSSGCPLFTADDVWNADVSGRAVNATWTNAINSLLGAVNVHPDFGPGFGIPINVVPADQPKVPIAFDDYADESDPGPYPFPGPSQVKIEGGTATACEGDCHVLVVQQGACQVYEGYACHHESDGWHCANGARWDLTRKSEGQRPDGWTSADAAGLSIYAGLARYEEVMAGEITHALRFTLPCTANDRVAPATHQAVPSGCSGRPATPMGIRVRLKASYDISGFAPVVQTFLRAFKKHGLILADNGGRNSTFYFQSEDHPDWPDAINDLKDVPVSAFEAVEP